MQVTGRIVVYPQRTGILMGYGIWRDPRAASSVWPCIAPNGFNIYQFSQAPSGLQKKKKAYSTLFTVKPITICTILLGNYQTKLLFF